MVETAATATAAEISRVMGILTGTVTSIVIATSTATAIEILQDVTAIAMAAVSVTETVEVVIAIAITRDGEATWIAIMTTAIGRGAGVMAIDMITLGTSAAIGMTIGETAITIRSTLDGGVATTVGMAIITTTAGIGGAATPVDTIIRSTGGPGPPLRG
jgi:hypothetical protein